MNTEELIAKAEELVGRTITHEGRAYLVKKVKRVNGTVVILTDSRSIPVGQYELAAFLESVGNTPVPQPAPAYVPAKRSPDSPVPGSVSLAVYEPTEAQKQVQSSLLSMLQKVQAGPEAIPQANAVCAIANTMINVERQQLQMLKFVKEMQG